MFRRYFNSVNHSRKTLLILIIGTLIYLALVSHEYFPGKILVTDDIQHNILTTSSEPSVEPAATPTQMAGPVALKYMAETAEGRSLMEAVTVARFGLKAQEQGPYGEAGDGYLGTSHDQNLNAWFAKDAVIIHPTDTGEEHAWRLEMQLRAYGYGDDLIAAPPVVSRRVKSTRIEYERGHCRLPMADCRFVEPSDFALGRFDSNELYQSAVGNRQSPIPITEWYENRAEGIEQGFTIHQRPGRRSHAEGDDSLRLVVSLAGSLRARGVNEGRSIELTDALGKAALTYSGLTAVDADSKQLSSHMEVSDDGSEIVLVVTDKNARYPIVIDPIVASIEKILDASTSFQEVNSQFGFAILMLVVSMPSLEPGHRGPPRFLLTEE
ncbi:MAG: hypothetical protein DMF69_20715 [Acidobacteria bacterium]|nr:MAG: hypothetical protein DMF69_20715 [Acidobacteriota bacterium]